MRTVAVLLAWFAGACASTIECADDAPASCRIAACVEEYSDCDPDAQCRAAGATIECRRQTACESDLRSCANLAGGSFRYYQPPVEGPVCPRYRQGAACESDADCGLDCQCNRGVIEVTACNQGSCDSAAAVCDIACRNFDWSFTGDYCGR